MIVSPGCAALIAFWMDSPGPTTLFAACAEPIAVASATPLATNRVRAMVANNTMVRLIKRPPLCRGAKEERCQTPAALRNKVSMKRLRDLAQLPRIPIPRTPVNKDHQARLRFLVNEEHP